MSEINPSLARVDIESRIAAQNGLAAGREPQAADGRAKPSESFAQALRAADQGITLSGHAQSRLSSRRIELTDSEMQRLGQAMDRAAAKGARSSLVLMDRPHEGRVGLVVSVPNRTVITAVDALSLKENIFTNIDSAMIL